MNTAETRRFSLAEYDEMIRAGKFSGDNQCELLDRILVKKMSKGPRHVCVTHRLDRTLLRRLPPGWHN